MVTAVSGYIEQVGSVIKEIPKHNYHLSTQFRLTSNVDTQERIYAKQYSQMNCDEI